MPLAMAITQADVDAEIANLLATGSIKSTAFDAQKTEFSTLKERIEFLAFLRREVAAASGGSSSRTRFAVVRKGA